MGRLAKIDTAEKSMSISPSPARQIVDVKPSMQKRAFSPPSISGSPPAKTKLKFKDEYTKANGNKAMLIPKKHTHAVHADRDRDIRDNSRSPKRHRSRSR